MTQEVDFTNDQRRNRERAIALTGFRHTIHLTILGLSIVLAITPAFARRSSSPAHLFNDPDAKGYSHNGLPHSTISISQRTKTRSLGSLQQLDQIEHQTANVFKGTSHAGNRNIAYRTAVRGSEQRTAFNFNYHAPSQSGAGNGRSRARGR